MRVTVLTFVSAALVAVTAAAAPPGPDITVVQAPVTGDMHFGGQSHYHITFTFTDADGVQNARYVNPDAGGVVNLGGGCTSPFSPSVVHKKKVTEAHADDCGDPLSLSHFYFLAPVFGNAQGVSTVPLDIPKLGATVVSTSAPPGVTVTTSTAPNEAGTGTTVTVTISNPTRQPARVRVGIDPPGDMFFYEFDQLLAVAAVPALAGWGLVLFALLVAAAAAFALRRRALPPAGQSMPG